MPSVQRLQDAIKQRASGTGTNTASRVQWVLAERYGRKYFFLMWEIDGHCNSCATTIYDDDKVSICLINLYDPADFQLEDWVYNPMDL